LFDGSGDIKALQVIAASMKPPKEPGYDWNKFKGANDTLEAHLTRRRMLR
jgi:hypothetical protein